MAYACLQEQKEIYETVGRLDSGKSKLKCVSANKDSVFGIN